MKEKLLDYISVRRQTAFAYLLAGGLTLAAGVALLFFLEPRLWRGLASSVIGLSLIHLWTGAQLLRQAVDMGRRLPGQLRLQPGRFRHEELVRCDREETRFNRQRSMTILLIVLGVVLTLVGGVVSHRPFTAGMGFGLCLQGAVLLVFNLTAHWHQSLYQHGVERFDGKADSE